MNLRVRPALESDRQKISNIIIAAFGNEHGNEIDDLITDLLVDPTAQPLLSLVATENDKVVGYILFTNTRIKPSQRIVTSSILAPLAVHPEYQNMGIGGRLIKEGLKQLHSLGVKLVFVLGHPGYYPTYGFSPAGIKGFEAMYSIPPINSDAWMVQEIYPGSIGQVSGQVICADALDDIKYWQE